MAMFKRGRSFPRGNLICYQYAMITAFDEDLPMKSRGRRNQRLLGSDDAIMEAIGLDVSDRLGSV